MEHFTTRFSHKRGISDGTMSSSSSYGTSSSATSFDSTTTPPTSPLLKSESFDWAEDVEEELERQAQKELALNTSANIATVPQLEPDFFNWAEDVEETLEREQSLIEEEIVEEQTDEEHISEVQVGDEQIVRALGDDLGITQPYHYRLPACAWNLYHLTCSLVEYQEYAQQLASDQVPAVPLLVVTDETGSHYIPEEVVDILTEEEIHEIRQFRDPYQEEFEDYGISSGLSSEQHSPIAENDDKPEAQAKAEADAEADVNSDEVDENSDEIDKECRADVLEDVSEYIDEQDEQYLSYGQPRVANTYLLSYGDYRRDNSPDVDKADRNVDSSDEDVDNFAATIKPAARPQKESDGQAQFIRQLEEVKEVLDEVTGYAEQLKIEIKDLNAECWTATKAKEHAEADVEDLKRQLADQSSEKLADPKDTIVELQLYVAKLSAELKRTRAVCQTAIIEKERVEVELQAMQDQMVDHSDIMEDLSMQIEGETLHLQDEFDDLRESYARLEELYKSEVQETESLRKKVETYESLTHELQSEADEAYLHQVRCDALALEFEIMCSDGTAGGLLLPDTTDAEDSKHSLTSTGYEADDVSNNNNHSKTTVQVTNSPTSFFSSETTISDNHRPIISPIATASPATISTSIDSAPAKQNNSRTWTFTGAPTHTFSGPGALGLSAYRNVFHDAFRKSASSILMQTQKTEYEKILKARRPRETAESRDKKQADEIVAPVVASLTRDYFEFRFLEGDEDAVDEGSLLHAALDSGYVRACEDRALPVTGAWALDTSTSLGRGAASVRVNAVGDAVGGDAVDTNSPIEKCDTRKKKLWKALLSFLVGATSLMVDLVGMAGMADVNANDVEPVHGKRDCDCGGAGDYVDGHRYWVGQ